MTEEALDLLVGGIERVSLIALAGVALYLGYTVGGSWPWWLIASVLPGAVLLFPVAAGLGVILDGVIWEALRWALRVPR